MGDSQDSQVGNDQHQQRHLCLLQRLSNAGSRLLEHKGLDAPRGVLIPENMSWGRLIHRTHCWGMVQQQGGVGAVPADHNVDSQP